MVVDFLSSFSLHVYNTLNVFVNSFVYVDYARCK